MSTEASIELTPEGRRWLQSKLKRGPKFSREKLGDWMMRMAQRANREAALLARRKVLNTSENGVRSQ